MIHHRDTPVKHKHNGFTGQAEDTEKRKKLCVLCGAICAKAGQALFVVVIRRWP